FLGVFILIVGLMGLLIVRVTHEKIRCIEKKSVEILTEIATTDSSSIIPRIERYEVRGKNLGIPHSFKS
ncbi:MAG TPA: hypothetical protein VMY41_11900, partial [Thermohalobaculum sp.]|nr:hypothetical protein [Thermohalobaculum sp.]